MLLTAKLKDSNEFELFGGKTINLSKLMNAGFSVPDGFAVGTEAYLEFVTENGLDAIIKSCLLAVDYSSQVSLEKYSEKIRSAFLSVSMPDEISNEIETELKNFDRNFAVRSSATAEDLPTMSFAGLQDTYLNIMAEDVEEHIIKCFASLWTARAISYRHENNIPQESIKIAVVVQEIVDADASGVAFTVNPVTNDLDELVINSNFGLGESVVSGSVEPDTVIYNKLSGHIIEKKIGSKETVIISEKTGHVIEKKSEMNAEFSLSDEQIHELAENCKEIEALYKHPTDIEWCVSDGKIFILQARHVTTYIPIPDEMTTEPGQDRLLYVDALITGQGVEKHFSILGSDYFYYYTKPMLGEKLAKGFFEVKDGIFIFIHGKYYLNVSNLSASTSGRWILNKMNIGLDSSTTKTIMENLKKYKPKRVPKNLRFMFWKLIKGFKGTSGSLKSYFAAYKDPEKYMELVHEKEKEYVSNIENLAENYSSYTEFARKMCIYAHDLISVSLYTVYSVLKAQTVIKKIFKKMPAYSDLIIDVQKSFPGNVTMEMGFSMYDLSRFDEVKKSRDYGEFIKGLEGKSFSSEFMSLWEDFMRKYGFRAPMELDVASEKPYENPKLIFDQLKVMAESDDPESDPRNVFEKSAQKRQQAFKELKRIAEKIGKAKKFEKAYEVLNAHLYYRESHKYWIVWAMSVFKREILKAGRRLVTDGRLDYPNQIFDLKIEEIDMVLADEKFDIHDLRKYNTRYTSRISHIKKFPAIFDSRGRIINPAAPEGDKDLLVGDAISPGKVIGKVKVLHSPFEKPLHPGEILVTRSTDPGWTPLFVNATAVVLEMGGMLQHGAMVAREYGKPCVSGIGLASERLKDGMMIEVDGSAGTVRVLKEG